MKKLISSLLVVVVLFNFIFCGKSYALDSDTFDIFGEVSEDAFNVGELVYDGAAYVGEKGSSVLSIAWDIIGAIFGAIAGIIAAVLNLFPELIQLCMTLIAYEGTGLSSYEMFTIEDAVFNKIGLFNVNYFNFNGSYVIGNTHTKTIQINTDYVLPIKKAVAKYFLIMRLIAIAISLLILIYVGIRMAASTISSDKAKYKKMLLAWAESIIMLFFMQYIISAIFIVGDIFSDMLYDWKCNLNGTSFEIDVIDEIFSLAMLTSGWTYVLYSIVYWFLIFIQTKFFLSYFKRLITVGFLIIISPLITITYPIDKMGDGKAHAFTVWFGELAINVFIQPIHAIIYLVFMFTAGEIAKYSIFVAAIFLLALTKVEKVILKMFNLKNIASLKPVEDERKK